MSLLSTLLERRDPEERAITPSMLAWDRGDTVGTFYKPAGVNVDRDSMLGVSAVWACVSLISDSIATLPLGVYRDEDGYPARGPSPSWLTDPNPEQTIVDFKFGTVASLLLHGNAFIYLVRDEKMNILQAWVLDPRWVQVRREPQANGKLGLTYYVEVGKGMQSPVGPFRIPAGPDMFHIMAFQPNSSWPEGVSPLDTQRMMFAGAIAGQEMGTRWFGEGFNAAGVIEVADDFTPEQAKQLKRDFKDANTGGPRKMHLPPVLTGGATWKQIQISPEQAQFLEQRQFSVNEIARFFRVPPHMIGNLEKTTSWGSGIEELSQGFVRYTLRPWIERIEESWTRNMLTFAQGAYFRFDTAALERGNLVNQADYFTKMHGIGALSSNEIRADLGKAPFDGGDDHYFMVNTAPQGVEPVSVAKVPVDTAAPAESKSLLTQLTIDASPLADEAADRFEERVRPILAESLRVADAALGASHEAVGRSEDALTAASSADAASHEAVATAGRSETASGKALKAAGSADAASLAAVEASRAAEKLASGSAEEAKRAAEKVDAAQREAEMPKVRSVKLPGGKKGTLLVDGATRILELEDGRRVEVEGE